MKLMTLEILILRDSFDILVEIRLSGVAEQGNIIRKTQDMKEKRFRVCKQVAHPTRLVYLTTLVRVKKVPFV